MAKPCSICTHPKRREIDDQLVRRVPYRNISEQFFISPASLSRHVKAHLPQELALAERKRQEDEADEILGDVRRLQVEARLIFREAKADGLLRTALAAMKEERHTLILRRQIEDWERLEKRLDELEERAS